MSQTVPDVGFTLHLPVPAPVAARSQRTMTTETTPRQELEQPLAFASTTSHGGSMMSSQSEQQQEASTKTAAYNKGVHIHGDEGGGPHMNRLYSMLRDASSKVSGAGSAALGALSITGEHTTSLQKKIVDQYQQSAGLVGAHGGSMPSSSDDRIGGASDDVHMDDEGGHLKRLYSSFSENADIDGASTGSRDSSGSGGSIGDATV